MPRAVRFDHYGGSDVLSVVDIDQPHPGPGEVVVRVVAAATNPGEMLIREGAFADVWPATFPEGQGNDFSGRIAEVAPGEARFSLGDEVIGFLPRAAQADYVVSASDRLARKPPGVSWEVAAAIPAAGSTASSAWNPSATATGCSSGSSNSRPMVSTPTWTTSAPAMSTSPSSSAWP